MVRQNYIRAEQPGRAGPGKNVEIANAEHQFRASVDDPRSGKRRFAERERERLTGRLSRGGMDLETISLAHPLRNGSDVLWPRWNNLGCGFHRPSVTSGMIARMVIGSGSNCFTNIRPLVFQSHCGVIFRSPV